MSVTRPYAAQLRSVLLNLQFPADYIADIE